MKLFGAVGNGTTDDTTAIQLAIDTCISGGGGTVYMPAGDYLISSTLDFSALSGTLKQLTFAGDGGGGWVQADNPKAATRLKYTGTGHALKAQGTSSGSAISGLMFRDFGIYCTQDLGATSYAIYWDGVYATGGMRNLVVSGSRSGNAACGSGIAVLNPFNGQMRFENVIVSHFNGASCSGFRFDAASTANFVGGLNSGNFVVDSCLSVGCTVGFKIGGSGNLLNGAVFNACKAVARSGGAAPETGFYVPGQLAQCVFNACHSEDHDPGFLVVGANALTFNSPLVTCGSPTATQAAMNLQSTSSSTINSALLGSFDYGVKMDANCHGNYATVRSFATAPIVTSVFSIAGTANKTWKLVDGYPTGYELGFQDFQTNKTATATTEATANTIVTAPAITVDGQTPILIEFYSPGVSNTGANNTQFVLYDGSSSIGKLATYDCPAAGVNVPMRLSRLITPAAATKTYSIRAYVGAGTTTVTGGAGGLGNFMPGFIRITAT